MLFAAAALVAAIPLGLTLWKARLSAPKDLHVEAELQSGINRPALELPGTMRVNYLDLGDRIRLSIASKSNPILYIDVNQDHALDKGDISYAPLPDNRVCVATLGRPLDGTEDSACGTLGSSASVKVTQAGDIRTVNWEIPKVELGHGSNSADIVIRTFHENTQQGEYYPAEPFQKVYRVIFLQAAGSGNANLPSPVAAPRQPAAPSPGGASPTPASIEKHPIAGPAPEPAPEIVQFEAAPNPIQPGGSALLKWEVRGAPSSVEIQPAPGTVELQGQRQVTPSATTRYLLIARGRGGTVTREVTVAVAAAPPTIASFSSDAAAVAPGGTARLRWNVTGAVNFVKIDPVASGIPASGSRDVTVSQTTSYVLTAEGPGGTVTDTLTVRATPQPPVVSFDSTPPSIRAGDAVTLQWTVTGAAQVSIQPGFGSVAATGSETIHPMATTQYTLVASSAGGSTGKTVTVTVARPIGPSRGQLVWSGDVRGTQLVTIDRDHADIGSLQGSLPGAPCIVQPVNPKTVSVASSPGPRNRYLRLVLRIKGDGPTRVVVDWALQ